MDAFPEIVGTAFERAVLYVGMVGTIGDKGAVDQKRRALAIEACRYAGLPEADVDAVRSVGYAIVQYRQVLRSEKRPERFLAMACALHGAAGHETMVEALALLLGKGEDPVDRRLAIALDRLRQGGFINPGK